jgi:5'-nucleotidase
LTHPKIISTFAILMAKTKKAASTRKKTDRAPAHVEVSKEEPIILVTNDDGITAPGIHNLVEAVKDLGKIVVVAPDKPQSGMGHAITIGTPLR